MVSIDLKINRKSVETYQVSDLECVCGSSHCEILLPKLMSISIRIRELREDNLPKMYEQKRKEKRKEEKESRRGERRVKENSPPTRSPTRYWYCQPSTINCARESTSTKYLAP